MIFEILDFKNVQVRRVVLSGDSEMVIKKMTDEYQERHTWMRSYRNTAQDLIEGVEECIFKLIPIVHKCIADSLDNLASAFNGPTHPIEKYEIEVRHRPSISDNVKSWKVFEYDTQIHQFLTLPKEI